jgi:hypothetical protein
MSDMSNEVQFALLEKRVSDLELKIDALHQSVDKLVKAWDSANTLITFVKWVGGAAAAATAILIFLKGFK